MEVSGPLGLTASSLVDIAIKVSSSGYNFTITASCDWRSSMLQPVDCLTRRVRLARCVSSSWAMADFIQSDLPNRSLSWFWAFNWSPE